MLRRAGNELTGALVQRGNAYFVQPTSKKYPEIMVDRHSLGDARVGDRVAVSVSHYGDEKIMPQGVIQADLGEDGTMEASIAAILHENAVFDFFPDEVLRQADAVPQEVDRAALHGRLDLRDKLIFTIDGDDAKDFDDAGLARPTRQRPLPARRAHCGRIALRHARQPARPGGVPPRARRFTIPGTWCPCCRSRCRTASAR